MIFYIPWMPFNLLYRYPIWHSHQNLLYEIFALWTDMTRNLIFAVGYFMYEQLDLFLTKRQMPADHRKQYNPTTPNIRKQWVIIHLPLDNLRRGITWRPTERF